MATRIAWSDEFCNCEITVNDDGLNIDDAINRLVRPILRAAGYSDSLIEEYIPLD